MRKSGIAELLGDVKETITVIDNEYAKANEDLSVKEFFKIRIKHALEDMRSCLDYVANDIYDEVFYANDGSKKPELELANNEYIDNNRSFKVRWSKQYDDEISDSQDGYAGVYNIPITKLLIGLEKC